MHFDHPCVIAAGRSATRTSPASFLVLFVFMMIAVMPGPARAANAQQPPEPDEAAPGDRTELPPQLTLGLRAAAVRLAIPTADTVVLVPDEVSLYAAIESWSPALRFPVLIEDGSPRSIEDAARFVRGFEPARVVHWAAPERHPVHQRSLAEAVQAAADEAWDWPADRERTGMTRTRLWGAMGPVPPAVVLADEGDPARADAAALAAFYGLPIAWVDAPNGLNRVLTQTDLEPLEAAVRAAAEEAGLTWSSLGDDVDAIALCANSGVKLEREGLQTGKFVAMTDALGRTDTGERWAWASQIHGDARESLYRVMSSMFLRPQRAWLFDGYGTGDPWNSFDATAAEAPLNNIGIQTETHDEPRQDIGTWRSLASASIDAGLVMVNSSGNPGTFTLRPGIGQSADAPFLRTPAAVHFVHSWSATRPGDERTVAGRWFARGAFAYAGSVEEPYLSAFVPTPQLAVRLGAGAAWAAAVRHTPSPVWKVQAFGDPLFTLANPPRRIEGEQATVIPLEEAADLSDELRSAARDRRTADAARVLVLLGRDGDASDLARAALSSREPLDPLLARATIMPLLRDRARREVVTVFRALSEADKSDQDMRDALWHASFPLQVLAEAHSDDTGLIALLTEHPRAGQYFSDAARLAKAWQASAGLGAAINVLRTAAEEFPEDSPKRRNAEQFIEEFRRGEH